MNYYRSHYGGESHNSVFITVIIIGIVIVFILGILPEFTTNTYNNITITDKDYSGTVDSYMIWGEDENGTHYEFENSDSLLRGKFNSGTVQGKLKEGSTYNIKTIGWRIPLFSMYQILLNLH